MISIIIIILFLYENSVSSENSESSINSKSSVSILWGGAFSIFDFLSYFFVALWFVLVGSRMALQGNGYFLSEPLSSVSQPLPLDQCYNQQPGQQ